MTRTLVVGLFALALVWAVPQAAQAAVCADHPNQASAQAAQDTRDADGDGVYCEALPCPCAGDGGNGGGSSSPVTRPRPKPKPVAPVKRAQRIRARITSVVDGDTIKVKALENTKRDFYTVRLIGIDTPETKKPGTPIECGGKRAVSSMLNMAFSAPEDSDGNGLFDTEGGQGRRVTLLTDPSQSTFDRYGRLLAYVTTASGNNLARSLLSNGWANLLTSGSPFSAIGQFTAARRTAKSNKRGSWRLCGGNFHRGG